MCKEWESCALKVDKDVKVVLIRIGVVLGKDGGALGVFICWYFVLIFFIQLCLFVILFHTYGCMGPMKQVLNFFHYSSLSTVLTLK